VDEKYMFESFRLHCRQCYSAQQPNLVSLQHLNTTETNQFNSITDPRRRSPTMQVLPSAQSIIDTLLYMTRSSHPILFRLGVQQVFISSLDKDNNDSSSDREGSYVDKKDFLERGSLPVYTLVPLFDLIILWQVVAIALFL
jgi:hypothetical protein